MKPDVRWWVAVAGLLLLTVVATGGIAATLGGADASATTGPGTWQDDAVVDTDRSPIGGGEPIPDVEMGDRLAAPQSGPALARLARDSAGTGSGDAGVTRSPSRDGTLSYPFPDDSSGVSVDAVYVGDGEGLVKLDASDGTQLWKDPNLGGVTSSPTVVNGVVYVGATKGFFAFNSDGSVRWSKGIGEVTSSPTVVDGRVFIGTESGTVYAFDASTGEEVWSTDTGGISLTSPQIRNNGNYVFIGGEDGTLRALATDTGTVEWTQSFSGAIKASPIVYSGTTDMVIAADQKGEISAFTLDGKHEWSKNLGQEVVSSPIVANGQLFVATRGGTIAKMAPGDGELLQSFVEGGAFYSSPTYYTDSEGEHLFIGDENGAIWWFDAADISTHVERISRPTIRSSPTVESLYNPGFYAYGDRQGVLHTNVWTKELVAPIRSSPTLTSSGSSVDSRVKLGTLGHHGDWAGTTLPDPTPAQFDVSITGTNSPVTESETLEVTAEITNSGDLEDQQTVALDVAGTQEDSTTVSLGGGESQTVTLTWQTESGDAGTPTVTAYSDDDSDLTTVTVESASAEDFAVTISQNSSPEFEGDTLRLVGRITNEGDAEGTQTIRLLIDGTEEDSESLTLAPGETDWVSLYWPTEAGDAGTYTATVQSDDDADSESVKIREDAPYFDVTDVSAQSVEIGEQSIVNVDIENTGSQSGRQTIEILVDGVVVDSYDDYQLDTGERGGVALSWETGPGDAGDRTIRARSEDDSESTTVTVDESDYFAITSMTDPNDVMEGETVHVSATIENQGGLSGQQDIIFEFDGAQADSVTRSLDPGQQTTVDFSYQTDSSDTGYNDVVVRTEEEERDDLVYVEGETDPAYFDVQITGTNSPVTEGETLQVTADITNTGDEWGSQTIRLNVDGSRDSETVSLSGGQTKSVTLEWTTTVDDAGSYPATVGGADDSDSTAITVEEETDPPFFLVDIVDVTSPVSPGDTVSVSAKITNTGGSSDTQTIGLGIVDGGEEDTTSLQLSSGESNTVTLDWATSTSDGGEYTAVVGSNNDSDSTTVSIEETSPPFFDVTIDTTNSPVAAGETAEVTATIENTGDAADTQRVGLDIDGTPVDAGGLLVYGGEAAESFVHQTGDWSHRATLAPDGEDSTAAGVAVSPDGEYIATTGWSTIYVYNTDDYSLETRFSRTSKLVRTVRFSPEGQYIAYGGSNDQLEVHRTSDWSHVATLPASVSIYASDFSADGDYVAYGMEDGVAIHSTSDWSRVHTITDAHSTPRGIEFSSNGEYLAHTQYENVRVHSVGNWSHQATLTAASRNLWSELSFSPDGKYIAYGGDWNVYVYDSADWSLEHTLSDLALNGYGIEFSPDGKVLAFASDYYNVSLYDVSDWTLERKLSEASSAVLSIDFLEGAVTLNPGEKTTRTFEWPTDVADAGTHTATVSSQNDSNATGIRVLEPASFDVDIIDTNEPVMEGETMLVNATVTNSGEATDTQTVDMYNGHGPLDSTNLTLEAGASENVTFSWSTETGDATPPFHETDPGNYTMVVESDDDSDSTYARVEEPDPPFFNVTIDGTNSAVVEGSTVEVTATIENTGDLSGSQPIELDVGGDTIPLGEDLLIYTTNDYPDTVYVHDTDDWSVRTSLPDAVQESVSGDKISVSPDGQQLAVANGTTANIYEIGDWSKIATISAPVGGFNSIEFSPDGEYLVYGSSNEAVVLRTEDWGLEETLEHPTTTVTSVSFSPDGENLAYGSYDKNVYVHSVADWTHLDTLERSTGFIDSVEFSPDSTQIAYGSSDYNVYVHDAETWSYQDTLTAASDDIQSEIAFSPDSNYIAYGSMNGNVFVYSTYYLNHEKTLSPPDASSIEGMAFSPDGANLVAGAQPDDAYVYSTAEWSLNETLSDSSGQIYSVTFTSGDLSLDSGENRTVTFEWDTSAEDVGTHIANVSSLNDSDTTSVTVKDDTSPYFAVDIDEAASDLEVGAGEPVTVVANITNTGQDPGKQAIDLGIGSEHTDRKAISLSGGETKTVTFESWSTAESDIGEYIATVASEDDSDTATVSVVEPAFFDVEILGTNAPVTEGETMLVNATVTNTGEATATQTIELYNGHGPLDSTTLTLSGGSSETVTFAWQTDIGDATPPFHETDPGNYTMVVESDDDADSTSAIVEEATAARVEIEPASDQTVTAGETISFNATAYDEYDNVIERSESAFNWTNATGEGVFDRTTAGEYAVTAELDGVESSPTNVTVESADAVRVELTPAEDRTITAGSTVAFDATAYDEFDNVVEDDDTAFTWANTIANGTFDETAAGAYDVTATLDGVSSAPTTVTVEPAETVRVELAPAEDRTIPAGETIAFDATAYDEYDNVVEDAESAFTWQNTTSRGTFDETTAGTYEVTAALSGVVSAPTTVTVESAAVERVELAPAANQTITAGSSVSFDATAYDEYDNVVEVDDTAFTWANTTAEGTFDETAAGDYRVTASLSGVVSAPTTVTVEPADVDRIELSPAANQTIVAGETVAFDATAYDQFDNVVEDADTAFTWSNAMDDGTFDETATGRYDVSAELDGVSSAPTTVTVQPADVVRVEIAPVEDRTITAGDTIAFDATAYDEYDNVVEDDDTAFTWANTTGDGTFERTAAGDYAVTATLDGVTSTATTVTVLPAEIVRIELQPTEDRTITAGETLEFAATAYDEFDNVVERDDTAFTWANTTADGTFDTTKAGQYAVTAALDGVTSAPTTVTVEPAAVDRVVLTPAEDRTITAGETVEFDATAFDEFDNVVEDDDAAFIWANTTARGTFDTTTAGEYAVTATLDGVSSAPMTVTVEPAAVERVELDPAADRTITAGDTVAFDATAYDEFDNVVEETDTAFAWANTTADGTFEQTAAGDYAVTATLDGVTSAPTVVTVEPAAVDRVEIEPAADQTITAGETVAFDATAYDEYDNVVEDDDAAFTWANTTATGTFERTTAGAYTVTATMDGVTSAPTVVTVEPAAVDRVVLDPAADQTITAGETVAFDATAYDEFDNVVEDDDSAFTWANTTARGTFERTTAGQYQVTAALDGVTSAPTTVTVEPAAVDRVVLDPAEDRTITAGETVAFGATAYDEFDNVVEDDNTAFTWANATANGTFDETTAGEYAVTATLDGVTSAPTVVTIEPAVVDRIELDPAEDRTITAGDTVGFDATAYDRFDNVAETDDTVFTWANTTTNGTFETTDAGAYTVTAALDGVVSDPVTVTVEPAGVDRVEIHPAENRTIQAGTTLAFDATAYDEFDNVVEDDDSTFTWQNSTANGTFDATDAGIYSVTATLNNVTSPPTRVTVEPASGARVVLEPGDRQQVVPGESIEFSATLYDEFDNVVTTDDTAFTWTAVDLDGTFVRENTGLYPVRADYEGASGDSTIVNVEDPDENNGGGGNGSTGGGNQTGGTGDDAPYFAVDILNTPSPVTPGETVQMTVEITNTGDIADTQIVTQDIAGSTNWVLELGLEPGESVTRTIPWQSGDDTVGTIHSTVESHNDSATSTIVVEEPATAEFEVEITDATSPLAIGDPAEITVSVTNVGNASDEQTVAVAVDERALVTERIALEPGESTTTSTTWRPADGDAGSHSVVARSDDDSATASIEVETADDGTDQSDGTAQFEVEIHSVPATLASGDTGEVVVAVENTGTVTDTQEIELSLGGIRTYSTNLTLESGESQLVTFDVDTTGMEPGTRETVVQSVDDSASDELSIRDTASGDSSDSDIGMILSGMMILVVLLLIAAALYIRFRSSQQERT